MDTPSLDLDRYFEAATLDDWRALVRATLKGRDPDSLVRDTDAGVPLRPLDVDRPEGARVLGRDGPWEIRQEVRGPGLKQASRQVRSDLARGGEVPWFRVDRATRLGVRPDEGRDAPDDAPALSLLTVEDLAGVLRHVDLARTPMVLEAGASGLALLGALVAVARSRDVSPDALSGTVQADPLATLARDGWLPRGVDAAFDDLAACVRHADEHVSGLRVVGLSALPVAEAGADASTELAVVLAGLLETVRRLDARDLGPDRVLPRTEVVVSLGGHLLVDLAKLRALRRLWARVGAALGVSGSPVRIHARQADATLATVDPWTNLLRASAAGFVGAVGGADALTLLPWDHALGESEAAARRIARNQQILLREEAHLDRVEDPAAGSFALEHLTDALCRAAWERFQAIEGGGGMLQALADGSLASGIGERVAARRRRIATRRDALVGVSRSPDPSEAPITRPRPDPAERDRLLRARWEAAQLALDRRQDDPVLAAAMEGLRRGSADRAAHAVEAAARGMHLASLAGAVPGMPFTAHRLVPERPSAPWEALRARVRAATPRPRVFLANLGPKASHKAREAFARELFEAGGFAVTTHEGFVDPDEAAIAFGTSACTGACICGTDDAYERAVPRLARQLTAAGAAFVVVAGRFPADPAPWREAGVTAVVHLGADVLATLGDLADRSLESA